jgi:CRISPR-associated endonuclease Cas3-HD
LAPNGNLLWNGETDHANRVGLYVLMGGEEKTDWDLYPEYDAILIGTQDMLLSRALNRGYGMSRYRWPMHFGLLNNDCLWVLDETQLMGVSVETSAQLDGFRGPSDRCCTWWMSATLDRGQLNTVDHREPLSGWPSIVLGENDRQSSPVRKRLEARKTLSVAPLALNAGIEKAYAKRLAEFISARHQEETLTLIVVNRVARAQAVYSALRKRGIAKEKLALIHSRFRPVDRERHQSLLKSSVDRIVVATQAVEAGVDISARLLITELAPWSSLVQRFGRCNRGGEFIDGAEVVWIDVDTSGEDLVNPYAAQDLIDAREGLVQAASDVGPASLETPESYDADRQTFLGRWISIQDHTSDVIAATRVLISAISLTENESVALETAALWHDVGKAHPIFQKMLRDGSKPPDGDGIVWAKSASGKGRPTRKAFRHELASAIAWLIDGPVDAIERDLVGFLIAAHHGKVRVSIRALPDEEAPDGAPDCLHARGIWDGDEIPALALPGVAIGPIMLSLSFMQMGNGPHGASWLSRALALRDRLGPFRLAYLETLLRVADMRASAHESSNPRPCIL